MAMTTPNKNMFTCQYHTVTVIFKFKLKNIKEINIVNIYVTGDKLEMLSIEYKWSTSHWTKIDIRS